jgi:pSer/pThr/pTyr-binding forkhead associated (FHA) protein
MGSPVVQLRLKGRVLQTFSFQRDALRIGRMKENDIVISNASVSRFHAVLVRQNGRVILEDSGSENGCYVQVPRRRRLRSW